VLYPCKWHFRCAQAQHFLVFSWVLIALLRDPGKGTLKELGTSLPLTLPYGTTLRMVRASQWEAAAVMTQMAAATLRTLPPGGPSRTLINCMDSSSERVDTTGGSVLL